MFKDKYQYGQNVQLLNIQGKKELYILTSCREGIDQEVDGQRVYQESLRQVSEGLRLYHWLEF